MHLRYLFALFISFCFVNITAYADCLSPQYTYTSGITHQSGSLSWSYYGNSSPSYQVQWRVAGNASWNTEPVLTSSTYSLTGLTNNTNYEWKVRSICAAGDTSVFTTPMVFQTKCNTPTSPTVSIIGYQSVLLSWYTTVYGGATYEVQWRPAGTEMWTVVSNLLTPSLTLSGLPGTTFIEWKVRTMCSATASSDFVTGPLFQAQCLLPTNTRSTLTSPDAAELKWDSPLSNARFDLQWRQAGTSAWNVVTDISATEYILTGLANEMVYEWQVRMACSATDKSDFTEVQLVRTRCPTPIGLMTSSSMYNAATLQWVSAAPVNLQWRPAGTTTWSTQPGARSPYNLTGLTSNTIYEWRVQATCSSTAVSAYTPIQSLAIRCAAPVYPNAYPDEAGGLALSWSNSTGGLFEVQWRAVGTTNWSIVPNITNTYYTLTGLIADVTYEWGVRQVCSATEKSDYVLGPLARTRCSAPSYITVEKLTNTSADLVWNDVGPGSYEVQWRPVNTTDWTAISGITTTRYTLTGLPTNASYEWRVRKICSGTVMSAFSYNYGFSLRCEQPTYFSTSDVGTSSATLNWSGFNVYAPYTVQYRLFGSTNWISIANLTNTQYTLTGLVVNNAYEWRVQSNCSPGGSTNFSATQVFQTQCGQPSSGLNVQKIDVSSAELHWLNNSNNNLYEIQYRDITNPNWTILRPGGTEADPYFGVVGYTAEKQYMLYGLTPGKTYAWRIRILCTPDLYSDFVNGSNFTTACAVPPSPYAYQSANATLQLNWAVTTLAPTYELQWRAVGTPSWNVVTGLTNNYYTLTSLSPGVSYEYRIRQLCRDGVVSEFSPVSTTIMRCLNLVSVSPVPVSATSIRLDWTYYYNNDVTTRLQELQYRVYGTSTWTTVTGITGTTYSLTGLVSGATYEYRVRSICQPGIVSDYLSGSYQLTCPFSDGYVNGVGTTSASLSLSPFTSNQTYVIQWRVAGTTNWSTISAPSSAYTLTGLSINTTYEWRSATECGSGFLSDFSAIKTFQTSCPSAQNLSINSVGSNQVQLSWSVYGLSAGATYSVQYRVSGDVVWSTVSGFVGTSASLTGLLSNVTYECRIQTVCVGGSSSGFSSVGSFRTQCVNPSYVSTSQITTQSVLLTWPATADNAPIDLQWKPATGNADWTEVTGITGSAYVLTGLTPGTSYIARYRAVCSATDRAPYSGNTISFQTLSATLSVPPTPYADSISAQLARIRWTTSANMSYVLQWREKNGAWNTTGPLTTTAFLLPNLTPYTSYEIRLGLVDVNNVVNYGAINSFTTNCLKVANTATGVVTSKSALLTWDDTRLPISVQWRVGGTTNWTSVTGVVGGRYTLTGLANNTIYEWRIQTNCSADVFSATYPLKFRTLCRMPATTYTQSVASGSARLSWSNGGPEYSVQYRVVGTSTWTTVNSLTATTYTLAGLTTNTAYEWAVATACEPGVTTTYTSPLQFVTQCNPPTNLYVNATTFDREQLIWTGTEEGYQFQWRVQGSSAWNTESAVTAPYTLTGLTTGVVYEWRVRSECSVATDGPFVWGSPFTVQCSSGYYESLYTTGITSSTARFAWTMKALTTYRLRWRAAGTATWTNSSGSVESPYTAMGLTNNTAYEWQIRSECQSVYSASATFQTACITPGSPRTEAITTTSALLRWTDSGENAGYEVQWRIAGTSTWATISNINGTSYSLTGLATNTTYDWQVRSQCSGGSAFQTTTAFKTTDTCMNGMSTVRAGAWDDPTVWSCGRIPTLTDRVQLNHVLTIPNNYGAKVLTIRYETGSGLTLGSGATIRMGQ